LFHTAGTLARTETAYNRNADGSFSAKATTVTTADGLNITRSSFTSPVDRRGRRSGASAQQSRVRGCETVLRIAA
jgi:hypothetical protein